MEQRLRSARRVWWSTAAALFIVTSLFYFFDAASLHPVLGYALLGLFTIVSVTFAVMTVRLAFLEIAERNRQILEARAQNESE